MTESTAISESGAKSSIRVQIAYTVAVIRSLALHVCELALK